VICAEWHPDDERLLMRYVDRTDPDPSVDQHVARCHACAARLEVLGRDLDAWHEAATDASDGEFDDERLSRQRQRVQQRLGAVTPAAVLPFPPAARPERHAPLVRVAAAVLLVTLGGAGMLRVLSMPDPVATRASVRSSPARVAPVRLVREAGPDAAALEDIDLALARPRTAELRALDEFTPHVRDLMAPRR
jgi:hypothetical protein